MDLRKNRIKKFSSIYYYGIVSLTDSILIISGYCNSKPSSRIAKYKLSNTIEEWSEIGNLQHTRIIHRAIINENRIYIVGGGDGNDGGDL